MASTEETSDLQGLLGGILSRPDALQEILGVVSKLKESGVLENLLPLLGGMGSIMGGGNGQETALSEGSEADREGEGSNEEFGDKSQESLPVFSETSSSGRERDSARGEASHGAAPNPGLSLLTSLLSGAGAGKSADHEERRDGEKRERQEEGSAKRKRYEDHRRLLQSLRPYLGEERRQRIDFILKMLQIMELAGQVGLGDLFTASNAK